MVLEGFLLLLPAFALKSLEGVQPIFFLVGWVCMRVGIIVGGCVLVVGWWCGGVMAIWGRCGFLGLG